MKVVIVHNAYPQYGGEDTVVANEIAMLAQHGYTVAPWIVPTEESGILNLIRCGLAAPWNPFSRRKLKAFLLHEKPDIVHVHNTFPLLSPSVFAACHDAGIPVVQTIHNYRHICPSGVFYRDGQTCEECMGKKIPTPILKHGCYRNSRLASAIPAMAVCIQRVRRTFERDVDALIALNQFAKGKLVQGGLPAERIFIKPNFCLEPKVDESISPSTHAPFTVCYAGRLSADKGIETLLEAWLAFMKKSESGPHSPNPPMARLQIVGDGEMAGLVARATEQYDSIEYLGSLSHGEAIGVIAQASFLACPSLLYEGMPMTILEAFSVGTPVLASRTGGVPEMVDEGTNGLLFTPSDKNELQTLLHRIYSSPSLVNEMGKKAYMTYREHYSETVNFPMLEQIYHYVIERYSK